MPYFWIICGMAAVTAIPRLLPALLPDGLVLPRWVERWLASIPYAALGALIFPGVWYLDGERPWVGMAGATAAFITAWKGLPLGVTLAVAVAVVMGVKLLGLPG